MFKFKTAVAMAAFIAASGLAFAQDSTAPAPQAPAVQGQADCPAPGSVPEAELPANCKVTAATEVPKSDTDSGTAAATAPAPAEGESTATTTPVDPQAQTVTPTDQASMPNPADAVLASQFIGQAVYSSADENIGEINDLVIAKEKGLILAVVGVGGFLGIGEKDVAVPMENIQINKDANNNMKLVINMSREQLETSPTYDRTAAIGG